MPSLADLDAAVRSAIASRRIGQPVFVRLLRSGHIERACEVVAGWIGQPASRLGLDLAAGAGAAEHKCVVLRFSSGASAVVSAVSGPSRDIDAVVLGTRGGLYHRAGAAGKDWDDAPRPMPDAASAKRQAAYGILLVSGAHTHQELYAPAFAADPRCRLVAVTDEPDVDARRRELNERFGRSLGLSYLPDLAGALAREDVQIVSICAPPDRRARIAVRCAEAGKHLYLDKPLAPTQADADAIVAAVRRAGVRSQMFTFVTTPWARRAWRLVREHGCGRLLAVHADTFFAKGHAGSAVLRPRREDYPPARHQLTDAKRELDNIGVYPVALLHWLTGQSFRSVVGLTGNYFFAEHQRHDFEDFGLLAGRLDDGTPATVACGRCGWHSHPAGGVNRVVLVGSERTLIVDADRPRLELYADEPAWTAPRAHPEDPMAFWQSTQEEVGARPKAAWLPIAPPGPGDVAGFLDALDSGRDGEVNTADAAQVTKVLLAAYRSAASGDVALLE
jgi:predicted dehydrogenase